MNARTLRIAASLLVALSTIPGSTRGDGPQTGTIDGRVLDAQGQPLPGATVSLAGPQNTRTAVTDEEGRYRFGLLMAGDYAVSAKLEGLGSAEASTSLEPGQRRSVDLTLQGGTAEQITITSEVPLVNKYDTGAVSSIKADAVENVAYGNRSYASTLRQLPTVVNLEGSDNLPQVNGSLTSEVQILIEGVDTSNTRRGGEARVIMPSTALTETRVESMGFGAEYGRVTGGVINSTVKTGTNAFHGDFLYLGQNPKWRAENQFELERPDEMIDSYELSLGGPMVRDRAWFFAANASLSNNQLDRLSDGTVVDGSREADVSIVKLNFQPGKRHQIAATGIDSDSDALEAIDTSGDRFAIISRPLEARIITGNWSYAVTDSVFLEVKGSTREDDFPRELLNPKSSLDTGASPDDPAGNNFRYIDLVDNLRYNGVSAPAGTGYNNFPRDTASASSTFFRGNHEVKVGVDLQQIKFESFGFVGTEYRGRDFDASRPGGFITPQRKRIFETVGESTSEGDENALYVQDRMQLGERWDLHVGVRVDQQTTENDVGEEVDDSTEWAPRLAAVYDLNGNGRLLARASIGRYYQNIGLDFALREYSRLPTGTSSFDEFNWNPATRRYDIFRTHVAPGNAGGPITQVDHIYKDEATAGVDWQFSRNWVMKSRLVWHETERLYWGNSQYVAGGTALARQVRTWPQGYREYGAVVLEVNRNFSGGWSLQSNLSVVENKGNVENLIARFNDEELFAALGGVQVGTGAANATSKNHDGLLSNDQDRLNVVGMKRFDFGEHGVVLSGFLYFATGAYYGLQREISVAHPVTGLQIDTVSFEEPRDAHQLEDNMNLNLAATWSFPIRGRVEGLLGLEAANVTDEQEVVQVNVLTLEPIASVEAYQPPRELRLKVGVRF
jgi:hypothetical protein